MDNQFMPALQQFIVLAKAATYVGDGKQVAACRPGSHDLAFQDGEWSYLDSYYGGRDFIGQEVVYHQGRAVWAMNYYGRILQDELISPEQAGHMIKASLSRLYQEGRFLGGYEHTEGGFTYRDSSDGDVTCFTGRETISRDGQPAYELLYHGGLIQDE